MRHKMRTAYTIFNTIVTTPQRPCKKPLVYIFMKSTSKLLLLGLTAGALIACGNNPDISTNTSKTSTSVTEANALTLAVDAYRLPASTVTQESPLKPREMSATHTATNIALGAPIPNQTATARKNNETLINSHVGKPVQIGFNRDVAQTATVSATQQVLKWQTTKAGGHIAAININSAGAKGIRIGLIVKQLPASATLRFYAKGATTAFEISGADVLATLEKNFSAGDKTVTGRTYTSPLIKSTDATVEIELSAGVDTAAVEVSMPSITHLFMTLQDAQTLTSQATYSGGANDPASLSCQVDVTCTSPLPAASDAVAWLVYNKTDGAYMCSGTMLNDSLNSGTPYLLTANHCISSQAEAATLYTEFKYRSLSCNNASTGEYFPTATTGATLLYTAYNTDSTLVSLYGTPSTTVLFAGWDATVAPTVSTAVHNIHHPQGDQQRLSRGAITGYSVRSTTNSNAFGGSNITNGTILNVTLTTGLTDSGSSGSGLFKGTDANPQLIGQLFGGTAPSCSTGKNNVYGRFDVAFNSGMSDFLVQGVKGVSRFFNTQTGAHFYSISATEANSIKTNLPQFNYEGTPFKASTTAGAGLSPVYRFFNTRVGVHFFTNSAVERDNVIANLPVYQYEGIGWYAYANNAAGTVPLYRFFNTSNGVHFYTISTAERDSVIANLKQFTY